MPRIPEAVTHFAQHAWGTNIIEPNISPSYLKAKITSDMWHAGSPRSADAYLSRNTSAAPYTLGTAHNPIEPPHVEPLLAKLKLDTPPNQGRGFFRQTELYGGPTSTVRLTIKGEAPLTTYQLLEKTVAANISRAASNNKGILPSHSNALSMLPLTQDGSNFVLSTFNANGAPRYYTLTGAAAQTLQSALSPRVAQILHTLSINGKKEMTFNPTAVNFSLK